jgi:GH15 family glucan-1,4-alpha-glucosidase
MASPIADYALIGDCRTAALVGRDGSIDWLCWPRFDSTACFAALLGTPDHGRWLLAPAAPATRRSRAYRDGTLVLETTFETAAATASVVDFMPLAGDVPSIVRLVIGRRGRMAFETELILRFDFGRSVPWVTRLADGALSAVAGPHFVVLRTPVALRGRDLTTVGTFTVAAGETVPFVMSHGASYRSPPAPIDAEAALAATTGSWRAWLERCPDLGEWTAPVKRSLLTLKALTYEPTGGIVAAPTTSLPERPGGERNWDYRHCWLRDASYSLLALMRLGYYGEAREWRDWLFRAIAGSPDQIQIMYGIAGERYLPEQELFWLPGYQGSRPVRIGNAAAEQFQLDVYGEIAGLMYYAAKGGIPPVQRQHDFRIAVAEHLERIWRDPDEGIWEVRGGRKQFTHSKVMAWVAFDRMAELSALVGDQEHARSWRRIADRIHADVLAKGFDTGRGSFVQHYGSTRVDASLLQLAPARFLPATDPRIGGTIAAIEADLLDQSGLVRRYETESGVDGLEPGEGAFLACSFWLADNYILQGRIEEARRLFSRLLATANDVGLLAEEYDARNGRMLGNFPQAFSHVGLINTALNLSLAARREIAQPELLAAAGKD